MFGRAKKGVDITRECWEVLKQDRELLLFPVFSLVAGAAVIATVMTAGFLIPQLGAWALSLANREQPHSVAEQIMGGLCLFVIYFAEWFVVNYFNTALVGCALIRFSGKQPTVKDGFRIASGRLPQILGWTLVVAVVGTLLSLIEERLGWLGKFVIRLIGLAWAVATYFVVPVLAAEGVGPVTAVQRSVSLLKKTWGEGLAGNFVIAVISGGISILLVVIMIAGIAAATALQSVVLGVVIGVAGVLALLAIAIVSSALRQIFLAGLYRYAATGEVPRGFNEATLQGALRPKSVD
jgi:hypothetical protein